MIGTDQEPSREILDRLNAALGEGKYEIRYEDSQQGPRAIVRLREEPPAGFSRETAILFANGAARQQVDAVWQEAAARLEQTYREARQQEEQAQQQQAAEPPAAPQQTDAAQPVPTSVGAPAHEQRTTAAESRGEADLSGGPATSSEQPPSTEARPSEAPGLGARIKGAVRGDKGKGER